MDSVDVEQDFVHLHGPAGLPQNSPSVNTLMDAGCCMETISLSRMYWWLSAVLVCVLVVLSTSSFSASVFLPSFFHRLFKPLPLQSLALLIP